MGQKEHGDDDGPRNEEEYCDGEKGMGHERVHVKKPCPPIERYRGIFSNIARVQADFFLLEKGLDVKVREGT